jgi:hypothetical protein
MSIKTRASAHHIFMKTSRASRILLALLTIVLANGGPYALAHQPPVDVSGIETFFGSDCTIAGQPATCGVTFAGWIGGDGQVADGWEPPPGDFQGLWRTRVHYKDQAGFGKMVVILGGRYRIFFFDGHSLSGRVTGGTVEWPADEITDIGCGAGVAVVNASLTSRKQSATFAGCLHDLPIGSTIPMVWGVFSE